MKKLMLAAAIVCAAVMAQAAAITWAGDINYEDYGGEAALGSVEFFLNGDSLGSVDIDSALCSFEFDVNLPGTLSALATVTNFGESGDVTGTKPWSYVVTQEWLDQQPGGTEGGSLGTMVATGLGIGRANLADGPEANGYTSAVPEPTSGLLLLLGVAGLALRRRRA